MRNVFRTAVKDVSLPGVIIFAAFIVALAAVTILNRNTLNHDAVSYLSLANHYSAGRFDLAISGTWSPLISWTWAGLNAITGEPILSGRLIMAISALVFFAGAANVLALVPNPAVRFCGLLASAALGAEAAGELITPDLLSAGLYFLGCGTLYRSIQSQRYRLAFASGCLFGLSYLAKAALLPISAAVVASLFLIVGWARVLPFRRLGLKFLFCVIGLLLVATPWIVTLSAKYHRPTFSTTNRVIAALIAPPEIRSDHPTNRSFVIPESGRQSQFEDESILPVVTWSPLGSWRYFAYFLETSLKRIPAVLDTVRSADWTGLGVLGALFFFLAYFLRTPEGVPGPFAFFLIPVAWPIIFYLPIQFPWPVDERRYFLVTTVFIIACSLEAARQIGGYLAGKAGENWLVLANLMILLASDLTALKGQAFRSDQTRYFLLGQTLAPVLASSNYAGPVASLVPADKHPSIFLSFFLRTQWLGQSVAGDADSISASCARLIFTTQNSREDLIMSQHPDEFSDIAGLVPATQNIDFRGQKLYWVRKAGEIGTRNCMPAAKYF